jgi:hypothetical protein
MICAGVPSPMNPNSCVKRMNIDAPITSSGVTSGISISPFAAVPERLCQRCRPSASATPSGVAISIAKNASSSEWYIACRRVSSCQTEPSGSW